MPIIESRIAVDEQVKPLPYERIVLERVRHTPSSAPEFTTLRIVTTHGHDVVAIIDLDPAQLRIAFAELFPEED